MTILTPDEIKAMRASDLLAGARLFWALADEIAAIFDVPVAELRAEGRGSLLANEARKHLCKAALDRGLSATQVGKWLGGRDHSTIHHAARSAAGMGETALVFKSKRA